MRRSWIAAAAGTALLCLVPLGAAAATARPAHRIVPATQRIVVRPVTSSGHAVHGYRVRTIKHAGAVDCSYPSSSVAAVDDDIVECSPDADYAVACWRAAEPHHVLCLDSGLSDRLTKFRTSGKIAHTSPLHLRGPLDLELADGTRCSIRDGGAGTSLKQHPKWAAFYYCSQGRALWAPLSSKDFGIHRGNGHTWTVELAADNGKQHVHKVRVVTAHLVGTKC